MHIDSTVQTLQFFTCSGSALWILAEFVLQSSLSHPSPPLGHVWSGGRGTEWSPCHSTMYWYNQSQWYKQFLYGLALYLLSARDVRNRFLNFGSVFEKTRIRFGVSLVRLKKTWFGSDIIVIYYWCNSQSVKLCIRQCVVHGKGSSWMEKRHYHLTLQEQRTTVWVQ